MKKDNYLIVIPTDRLNGAERACKNYATELAQTGANVHVIILSRGDNGTWNDIASRVSIEYIAAPKEKIGLLLAIKSVFLLSRQFDLKQAFSSHTHVNSWLSILRRVGILKCNHLVCRESTVLVDRFSGLKLAFFKWHYILGYGSHDLIICQTDYMLSRLIDFIPRSARWPLVVIPNPVNVDALKIKSAYTAPSITLPTHYVCSVGRLIKLKGVDILIAAFGTTLKRYPNLNLLIIGDGPERRALETLSVSLGIQDKVHFLGHIDNPMPILAKAQLGVVSSIIEGFPNTLLEMMCLCPRVVSTLCAGGIENIKGIYTAPPNDPASLSGAMLDALDSPINENRLAMDAELAKRSPRAFVDLISSNLLARDTVEGPKKIDFIAQPYKKIIYLLANTLSGGGAEKQLLLIAHGLAALGVRVRVYILESKPLAPRYAALMRQAESKGAHFYFGQGKLAPLRVVARMLADHGQDGGRPILWTWGYRAEFLRLALAAALPFRGVASLRSASSRQIYTVRWLFRLGELVTFRYISNSHLALDFLARYYPASRPRSRVVFNCLPIFATPAPVPVARPEKLRVLMLGNVRFKVKGYDIALHIARRILAEKAPFTITIAGAPVSGDDDLAEAIRQNGVESVVDWVGSVSDPNAFLHSGHAFMLLSRYEGMPNALIEAMALGLPCVATNVGDLARFQAKADIMRLIPIADPDAAFEALNWMWHHWPEALEMGRRARAFCTDEFGEESMIRAVCSALDLPSLDPVL